MSGRNAGRADSVVGGIAVLHGLRSRKWRFIHTFGVALGIVATVAPLLKRIRAVQAPEVRRARPRPVQPQMNSPDSEIRVTAGEISLGVVPLARSPPDSTRLSALCRCQHNADNGVGLIHTTGSKPDTLAAKYAPLVPILRDLIGRPDTLLSDHVKGYILGQLDRAAQRFAAIRPEGRLGSGDSQQCADRMERSSGRSATLG